jgi:colanic acid/amylovoran biosynthesis glycosyltransferase
MQGSSGILCFATALPAVRAEGGDVIITKKFLDGMARYADLWDGKVRAVVRASTALTNNLDNVRVSPASLPYELSVLDAGTPWSSALGDASVVMCSLGFEFTSLGGELAARGVPVVYVTELSLRTRAQIARTSGFGPLRAARKLVWEANQERIYRRALARSAGVQCNGTPTFRAYQAVSPDALLYFDTRSTEDMLAHGEALAARFAASRASGTLRLAFSGRLVPIKGVDHLVPLAAELKRRGVPFSLSIYGAGESEQAMRGDAQRRGLGAELQFGGNLDFVRELTPRIRDHTDVFVCCHRQGDPSCTYLETMASGVPIVGYGNEAFAGLLEHVDAGRATPMDDVTRLADALATLARDRATLERWSHNALGFAHEHTFERTFARRVEHAARIARSWQQR